MAAKQPAPPVNSTFAARKAARTGDTPRRARHSPDNPLQFDIVGARRADNYETDSPDVTVRYTND